jgi:hypothetical protein
MHHWFWLIGIVVHTTTGASGYVVFPIQVPAVVTPQGRISFRPQDVRRDEHPKILAALAALKRIISGTTDVTRSKMPVVENHPTPVLW